MTVFGRMGTGQFDYFINSKNNASPLEISVNNAQCEIDAGLEGENVFVIVEAKNQLSQDFLIRQLYYPYRVWENRIHKPVVPVFLTYANDVFTLNIGRFNELNSYNSLEFVSQQRFSLVPRSIELNEVVDILNKAKPLPEPVKPTFPQADSFLRVLDLMTQLSNAAGPVSQQEFTALYAFSKRQTSYYTDAAIYLGFVEKIHLEDRSVAYELTKLGKKIMSLPARTRNLAIVGHVLRFRVFNRALGLYFQNARRPTTSEVVQIMFEAKVKGLSEGKSTIPRRARTVLSWLDWMLDLTTA